MMTLKLSRPLAFFDIETTGLNIASDRIVQISILKIFPDGKQQQQTFLINPGIPIPKEATQIHGITDEDVRTAPSFSEIAIKLKEIFSGADLAGYNCNHFDIPLLMEEFMRTNIDFDISDKKIVDVQTIFHRKEERTLSAAYKFYCGKELKDAHNAEADIAATVAILQAQLEKYEDLQNDIEYLHHYTSRTKKIDFAGRVVKNEKGVPVFNFGKHSGKPVGKVFQAEPQYYDWMMKSDFTLHTKKVITELYQKARLVHSKGKKIGHANSSPSGGQKGAL